MYGSLEEEEDPLDAFDNQLDGLRALEGSLKAEPNYYQIAWLRVDCRPLSQAPPLLQIV